MTWLVFAVSGLLALAGAISITSGAPYIQLERGWAEVIAGSVAFSSGGVVFALGVVLVRLEGLREVLARVPEAPMAIAVDRSPEPTPLSAAPLEPPAPRPDPALDAAVGTLPPEPQAEPVPAEAPTNQGLWKRIKRPSESAEATSLEATGFPDRFTSEPQVTPTSLVFDAPIVEQVQEPVVPPGEEPAPAPPEEAGQLGWLDRSLLKNRPIPGRLHDGSRQEPRVEPALDLSGRPEPDHHGRAEPAVAMPEAVPADEGPTVIGRYQAGVASYVMYSDGTIEVETESGQSHRFNSMDELKTFIAKQDAAGG